MMDVSVYFHVHAVGIFTPPGFLALCSPNGSRPPELDRPRWEFSRETENRQLRVTQSPNPPSSNDRRM